MITVVKRLGLGLGLLVLALLALIVFNTLRYSAGAPAPADSFDLGADTDRAARLMSEAVTFRTVSTDMTAPPFPAFLAFLQDSFPLSHATMDRVVLEAQTPLFK